MDATFFFNFFEKRIKRLFPVFLVVLFFSAIAICAMMGPELAKVRLESMRWAVLGLSNFFFLKKGQGYFDSDAHVETMLHLWSLSVEKQFYFVYPFLFIFLVKIKEPKKLFFGVALLFLLAVWHFIQEKENAYLHTISRLWEIFLGCALMFCHRKSHFRGEGTRLSAAGLFFVLVPMFLSFPQLNFLERTVPAVIGAALLIHSGLSGKNFVYKTLSSLVPVLFGKLSYSLYLVHAPVYLLFFFFKGYVSISEKIMVIIGSILLSFFLYHFVEKPVLQSRASRRKTFSLFALCAGLFLIFSSPQLSGFRYTYISQNSPLEKITRWWSDRCVVLEYEKKSLGKCLGGMEKTDRKPGIVLLGDSHAGNWIGLSQLLSEKMGRELHYIITGGGCSFMPKSMYHEAVNKSINCNSFNEDVWTYIRSNVVDGDLILLASSRKKVHEKSKKEYVDYIAKFSAELREKASINIVLIDDTPVFLASPYSCFEKEEEHCLLDKKEDLVRRYALSSSFEELSGRFDFVHRVDPYSFYCPEDKCSHFFDGKMVFFDKEHISIQGSKLYYETFKSQLNGLGLSDVQVQ